MPRSPDRSVNAAGVAKGSQWRAQRGHWHTLLRNKAPLQGREESPEISFVIINTGHCEHLDVFIFETLVPVMIFLGVIKNVSGN